MQPDIIKGFEDIQEKIELNDENLETLTRAREIRAVSQTESDG